MMNVNDSTHSPLSKGAGLKRKRYAPPTITRYGTLTEITRASANSGMLDGGSFSLRTGGVV